MQYFADKSEKWWATMQSRCVKLFGQGCGNAKNMPYGLLMQVLKHYKRWPK